MRGWLLWALAALGGHRWYMRHQHRCIAWSATFAGPVEPLTFGGYPIVSAIPLSVGEAGNGPVYFQVMS